MERLSFDLNLFLKSISFALDFVEIDVLGATQNHSRRVAYIALRLADLLGLSEAEQSDLLMYAVMHDNGLSEETLSTQLKLSQMKRMQRIENLKEHCEFGERNISHYPVRTNSENIIKYHHESYDGRGFFGISGSAIPILAQLVGFADFVDNFYHFEQDRKQLIIDYVRQKRKIRFSPEISDCFQVLAKQTKFWLDLKNEFIFTAISEIMPENDIEVTWQELFEITKVFSTIVDSNSSFTGRHTKGLIENAGLAARFYQFSEEESLQFQIAASLHDLGKLVISRNILEKPKALSLQERELMKSHTYYTKMALKQVPVFSEIREWAANHHERLDGNGYPERLGADQLCFRSRLMACLDIFQALSEDRPYRKGMRFEQAFSIMKKMAAEKAIDQTILHEFISTLAY